MGERLRPDESTGRPLRDDSFVRQIGILVGRDLVRHKPGPKTNKLINKTAELHCAPRNSPKPHDQTLQPLLRRGSCLSRRILPRCFNSVSSWMDAKPTKRFSENLCGSLRYETSLLHARE